MNLKSNTIKKGNDILVFYWSVDPTKISAENLKNNIDVELVNIHTIKPLSDVFNLIKNSIKLLSEETQ